MKTQINKNLIKFLRNRRNTLLNTQLHCYCLVFKIPRDIGKVAYQADRKDILRSELHISDVWNRTLNQSDFYVEFSFQQCIDLDIKVSKSVVTKTNRFLEAELWILKDKYLQTKKEIETEICINNKLTLG